MEFESILSNNSRGLFEESSTSSPPHQTTAVELLYACLTILSVICSALASGLTQGFLSINPLEMSVKNRGGTEEEKKQAARILPIISRHHVLLVTIMLFNALANEALPLFLDQLVPSWMAIILSVSLVLIVGEVIPSAIFTGPHQLIIASTLTPFVWMLIVIFSPIVYPIAYVLDKMLGREFGLPVFNRNEIYTMVQIQQEEGFRRGLSADEHDVVQEDEVTLIGGVFNLRNASVDEVMTKEIFSLSINEKLNLKVCIQLCKK